MKPNLAEVAAAADAALRAKDAVIESMGTAVGNLMETLASVDWLQTFTEGYNFARQELGAEPKDPTAIPHPIPDATRLPFWRRLQDSR